VASGFKFPPPKFGVGATDERLKKLIQPASALRVEINYGDERAASADVRFNALMQNRGPEYVKLCEKLELVDQRLTAVEELLLPEPWGQAGATPRQRGR
jgi:hypothetical protein